MSTGRGVAPAGERTRRHVGELRVQPGLSQQTLAERVGIPQTHVSAMDRGATFPNLMTVLRLAAALECRVTRIVSVFDDVDLPAVPSK